METKRKKRGWIILVCIAGAVVIAAGLLVFQYYGLKPFLTVEAGEALPEIALIASEGDRYVGEADVLPPGRHIVKVLHRGMETPILVVVRDTIAPSAQPNEQTITYGTEITPDKLVTRIRDAGVVAVTFSEPFDFDRIGDFPVRILLQDQAGNRSEVDSVLHIRATVDQIALEAGAPVPDAEAFLLDGVKAKLTSELSDELLHHVGTYPIRFLLANGQTAESSLIVSDTTAPQGESTFVWIKPEDPLAPDMLVDKVVDETTVQFSYVKEPDTSLLEAQEVTVRMTDEGGNTADVVSTLAITHVEPITVEASKEPLSAEVFGLEGVELVEPFIPDTPGLYTVPVTTNGEPDFALITTVDTTPPTVKKRSKVTLYTLHPAEAKTVFSASDLSSVTLSWVEEPDWSKAGEQTVRVKAVDRYDNETVFEDTIKLTEDQNAPELYGVVNRTAYVGEPIAYLAEVYAEDDVDGRIKVEVKSSVVPDKEGSYTVEYTATDVSGNKTSATCKFKMVKATVSEEEVRTLAQKALEKIITDDMVTAEKLRAVFKYVRGHVNYVGTSDKSDWRKEAVRGFKTGKGDCFTFYSVTRALLDELDINYMSVTRKGGKTRHYWVIVNIGTGWYHFDPTIAPRHKHQCFMWTNKQCQVKPYFWRYEQSSFPDIATEKFDYDAVVQMERDGKLP